MKARLVGWTIAVLVLLALPPALQALGQPFYIDLTRRIMILAIAAVSLNLILGYGATVNHDEIGLPLTAFVSIRPIDPSQPDDSPERLRGIAEIESCWSAAGEESYILKIRVAKPADLEHLLARIRAAANVSTRTTIVLSTYYENRPVTLSDTEPV